VVIAKENTFFFSKFLRATTDRMLRASYI